MEDYFEEVNKILSLIANQIKSNGKYTHPEAIKALIEIYNEKALDAFMRGLDGEFLGQFLKNFRPESLAQAYAYCISFQNVEFRKNVTKVHRKEEHRTAPKNLIPVSTMNRLPPKIPPRNFSVFQPQVQRMQYQPMQPRYQHQQTFRPFQQQNPYQVQRPIMNGNPTFTPRPPPVPQRRERSEPMEVDQSMKSRQINYSNRPQSTNQPPLKRPRLYFASTSQNQTDSQPEENQNIEFEDEIEDNFDPQQFERYLRVYESQARDDLVNDTEEDENVEFNFLE